MVSWIEKNMEAMSPSVGEMKMPVVEDFIVAFGITDMTDGPGEGMSLIGYLSSANSCYRTHGLVTALAKAFEQPGSQDD